MSRTFTHSPSKTTNQLFPASLAWGLESLTVGALIDSESPSNPWIRSSPRKR